MSDPFDLQQNSDYDGEDPTRVSMHYDPFDERFIGQTNYGQIFDVAYITPLHGNLYHGGCRTGLILPEGIKHVVSLYPWERYTINHEVDSELYIRMYDSPGQGVEGLDEIAEHVNRCRVNGSTLVHCQAGLNRSSLVVARALFFEGGRTGDEIVDYLRESRCQAVLCNPAFEAIVRSWGH